MNKTVRWCSLPLFAILFTAVAKGPSPWLNEKHNGFTLYYQSADAGSKNEYLAFIESGIESVRLFFGDEYRSEFDVFIHPDRHSLDSTWQHDWQAPGFQSECWMVAGGTATQLDLLSPMQWATNACEHRYENTVETQNLITHELIHVYHGQRNASPDFSDVTNIDWFVEGLATYASGQCDSTRIQQVVNAIKEDRIPSTLDEFWTGKLRYGISGTVVMYIDKTFGRNELNKLLVFNRKTDLLASLKMTETELINRWKEFMLSK